MINLNNNKLAFYVILGFVTLTICHLVVLNIMRPEYRNGNYTEIVEDVLLVQRKIFSTQNEINITKAQEFSDGIKWGLYSIFQMASIVFGGNEPVILKYLLDDSNETTVATEPTTFAENLANSFK